MSPNILKQFGEWGIKLKNRDISDYTRIQLKAFLELFAVAAYVTLAFIVFLVLRAYGAGVNPPLYFGIMLLLFLLLLFIIFYFSKNYIVSFQDIDGQLDMILSGELSEVRLPKELASTEHKLHALKEAMEKRLLYEQIAEQQKNDLVMYLAHDIRTPLTSVIGYLNLLDEAKDMPDAQREKYTHITLEKAYKLEKMINEFFEIARYSLRQIQLHKEYIDLCYMLVQLTDELLPVLNKSGNTAVIQIERDDIFIYGDREKLARVFNNILKNAIAYSYPKTEIVISAIDRGENVEILFCNKGKLIPPEKLEKLFDKFYRIDEAGHADSGNAGLGLAIAKEIVTLHGGTIRAKSENDKVTIIVTIPTEKSSS